MKGTSREDENIHQQLGNSGQKWGLQDRGKWNIRKNKTRGNSDEECQA